MESSREARMQQRMRGAQRHQVQDVSFGPFFTIPEPGPEASAQPSSPAPRTTPNSSAKRRRLDSDPAVPPISPSRLSAPPQPEVTSAPRSSRGDPYQLPEGNSADEIETAPRTTPRQGTTRRLVHGSGRRDGAHGATSRASGAATLVEAEEVGESPADAPGSGQRRRVRISGAASSSARLHDALLAGEDTVETTIQDSSPLTRKSRTSDYPRSVTSTKSAPRRSTRLSGGSEVGISPEASVASPAPRRRKRVSIEEPPSDEVDLSIDQNNQQNQAAEEDEEVAEEIDDNEAARQLGRKRPRRSVAEPSSGLGSEPSFEEPVSKRRRKGVEKKGTKRQVEPKTKAQKAKPATKRRRSTEVTGPAVSVEVQRFVAPEVQENEDGDAALLVSEIPEADRKGVNAIDVLSQMCEEIVGHYIESLGEAVVNAQNGAEKKEFRTKLRALEAYREELRTRFLEHTIALDTLFSLKKRVRAAQRQKLSLRNDIISLRAERDQVALRMDAARIKHEEDSKTTLHHIQMSSAMHDIDLAIESGLAAPELTAKEKKTAPPANLDLLISKISSQVSSRDTGVLKEIRDFNAFLERAAVVLEAR